MRGIDDKIGRCTVDKWACIWNRARGSCAYCAFQNMERAQREFCRQERERRCAEAVQVILARRNLAL